MEKSKKKSVKLEDKSQKNNFFLFSKKIFRQKFFFNFKIFSISFLILFISLILYKYFKKYDQLTPFENNKYIFGKHIDNKKWGSFRSGHYFSLKTLASKSMVFGFMWFKNKITHDFVQVRHSCQQSDNLRTYGWQFHDFDTFGVQEIFDENFVITTSFLIGEHSNWTAHINAELINTKKDNKKIENIFSFVPYFALDSINTTEEIYFDEQNSSQSIFFIKGKTNTFKNGFTIKIELKYNNSLVYVSNLSESLNPPLLQIKNKLLENLFVTPFPDKEYDSNKYLIILKNKNLINKETNKNFSENKKPNLVLQQIAVTLPANILISFTENNGLKNSDFNYTEKIKEKIKSFNEKFEEIFELKKKNYDIFEITIGKHILSNMIGSISSFYGYIIVALDEFKSYLDSNSDSRVTKRILYKYGPFKLLTSVPSRSFFPRGFLWDEGFNQLLIYKFNLNLTKTIIKSWFNLVNKNGWIPREAILGLEAETRVPKEFIVQNTNNANPPTFFITLESILNMLTKKNKDFKKNELEDFRSYIKELFPKLLIWYNYFNETQSGKKFGTYRWKGRNPKILTELNVKTLTSGLDDYPRASSPTDEEIHLDLFCWMLSSTQTMYKLSNFIDHSSKHQFQVYYKLLNKLLEKTYWSEQDQMYCDFGLHSKNVTFSNSVNYKPKIRIELEQAKYRCVNEFGYVSLFPFLLNLIESDNPHLNVILDKLTDSNLLWSKYGLRSLATNSSYYLKYNTKTDPPYWRGAIWININYLALKSLNYYSLKKGPYKKKSKDIFIQLKKNLISNIFQTYKQSGYLWESYDDLTGFGKGAHPFNGWSSLILLIMADHYI